MIIQQMMYYHTADDEYQTPKCFDIFNRNVCTIVGKAVLALSHSISLCVIRVI